MAEGRGCSFILLGVEESDGALLSLAMVASSVFSEDLKTNPLGGFRTGAGGSWSKVIEIVECSPLSQDLLCEDWAYNARDGTADDMEFS